MGKQNKTMSSSRSERGGGGGGSTSRPEGNNNYSLWVNLFDQGMTLGTRSFWIKISPSEDPKKLPRFTCPDHHFECGPAVIGRIIYLFGGWIRRNFFHTRLVSSMDTTSTTMDASASAAFNQCSTNMISVRSSPTVLTIDKKIYIFGSRRTGPLVPWAEVLDTESMSFTALAALPPSSLPLLKKYFISSSAIIKNGKQIILGFFPTRLLLLYKVEEDGWTEIYRKEDHPLGSIDERQFSSRCHVINNVLYSYDQKNGYVYAFDLDKNEWFEEAVRFLVINKGSNFRKEKKSLDHFKTSNSSPHSCGGLHHLGNGLLCVVFLEEIGDANGGTNHLHCILFTPVVRNSSVIAKVERSDCYEVNCNTEYMDSVAVLTEARCLEKERVDESMRRMGKQERKVLRKKK